MVFRNFYSGGGLDRDDILRRAPDWLSQVRDAGQARLIAVWRNRNLVLHGEQPEPHFLDIEEAAALLEGPSEPILLGKRGEETFLALDLSHHEEPPTFGGEFADLRSVGPLLDRWHGSLLAYARGLAWWHSRHLHCGVCGHPTVMCNAGHQR